MGMAVASDLSAAYTVSADHLLMKHDLNLPIEPSTVPSPSSSVSLRSIGHSSLAISANNAILAVGGWDGAIRLFSSKSLKPLGTLKYHREGVQALAFASAPVKAFTDATASAASTIELDFVSDSASAPTSVVDDSDSGSDTETEGPGPGVRQVVKRGAERGEAPRWRWLVSGSKDRRMAIWGLMDFGA
jgi:WD40 repeat protein